MHQVVKVLIVLPGAGVSIRVDISLLLVIKLVAKGATLGAVGSRHMRATVIVLTGALEANIF